MHKPRQPPPAVRGKPIYPLLGAYQYEAARAVLFDSLLGRDVASASMTVPRKQLHPAAGLAAVSRLWGQVVTLLGNAGWRRAATAPARQYCRECPPVGLDTAKVPKFAHLCRQSKTCPFCYGRDYIVPAFARISAFVTDLPDGLQIVGYRFRRFIPLSDDPQAWYQAAIQQADELYETRRSAVATVEAISGVVLNQFFPSDNRLIAVQSGVLVTRREPDYGLDVSMDDDCCSEPVTDRRRLVKVFAQAMPYPRELLYGDQRYVAAILNGLADSRRRVFFQYGGKLDTHSDGSGAGSAANRDRGVIPAADGGSGEL